MTEKDFITFVKKECKYYGVRISLRRSTYIIYLGQNCAGCFDGDNRVLVSALNRPDYLSILAHEYCHMTQWIDKCDAWMNTVNLKSYEAWGRCLEGEKVEMDQHFDAMRDLELDNEKRTVALIKRLGLPIDVQMYTKRANAYVMLYNYMKKTGRWPDAKHSPYKNERILAAMPDRFSLDYSKIPKRLERIYTEEGI